MIVHGLKSMLGPRGTHWIGMPDSKRRDRDANVVLGNDGKAIWDPIIEFSSRERRERFTEAVLAALCVQHPAFLDGGKL